RRTQTTAHRRAVRIAPDQRTAQHRTHQLDHPVPLRRLHRTAPFRLGDHAASVPAATPSAHLVHSLTMGRLFGSGGTRLALIGMTAAALTLAGCTIPDPDSGGENTGTGEGGEPTTRTVTRTKPAPELPPEPKPATTGDCPYLPTAEAESANGQGVG